jgi:hypothetical protein
MCLELSASIFLLLDVWQSENSDFGSLIRLYVLADKLCDLKSANMVVDRLALFPHICYSSSAS